jgi:hypothetical protein
LRAVQSSPLKSLNIEFIWSEHVASLPTFEEVLGSLKDWLGDDVKASGLANVGLATGNDEVLRVWLARE